MAPITVENRSRKWENSIQEREAKFTHDRSMRVFGLLSMMAPTKAEIHLRGEKEVDFTHSQSRRLFGSLSTVDLTEEDIDLGKEREVSLAGSR